MDLEQKRMRYRLSLEAGENVKILINDNEVFNETVGQSFLANVDLTYDETKL